MDETTTPETGVVDTPAEQDFSDFEKELEARPEAAEPEVEAPEDDDDSTPDEELSKPDEDFEEVEYEGKQYKLPKELKRALLREADYTRKTQEVSELRRQLEPLVQQAQEASEAEHKFTNDLYSVNARMQQLQATDWSQADELTAMKAEIEFQGLAQQALQLQGALDQARNARLSVAEQETALRFEEGRKVLAQAIPDFATKAPKLAEHAIKEYGFTAEELGTVDDPRFFIALNRLVDLEAQVAKQQSALKAVKVAEVKPVETLKGNSGRKSTHADTNDFLAFEKLADQKIRSRR